LNEYSDLKRAIHALADYMGWEIQSRGRSWEINAGGSHFEGMTYTKRGAFATMAWVATAPIRMGGRGLDPLDLPFEIGYRVPYVPRRGRSRYDFVPALPKRMNATEEAMFRRCFPRMTKKDHERWKQRWNN